MNIIVCIAFYYKFNKIKLLLKVLNNFAYKYKCNVDIFIDTNSYNIHYITDIIKIPNISIIVHENLSHPHNLTWMHRKIIYHNLNKYDYYIYCEDDLIISWNSFIKYIEAFNVLWPDYIPTFCRYEKTLLGKKYAVDIPSQINIKDVLIKEGQRFVSNPYPYSACWILDNKALISNISEEFFAPNLLNAENKDLKKDGDFYNRLRLPPHIQGSLHRELAASFPFWQLYKSPVIKLNNNKNRISEDFNILHIGNTYLTKSNSLFGKIKVQDIIK